MMQSERDIANNTRRQWLALVAGSVRAAVWVQKAEQIFEERMSNQIAKDLQRRRPPEQPPLVYLTLRGKHDLVRKTLRKFIQNRLRAKHRHHVDLIIRYLKFRLLQQKLLVECSGTRCVITCQRQVLTFLQMIRARKLLLHLQWICKECALLKVPNRSIDELRAQWAEQKRTVDPALLVGTNYCRQTTAALAEVCPADWAVVAVVVWMAAAGHLKQVPLSSHSTVLHQHQSVASASVEARSPSVCCLVDSYDVGATWRYTVRSTLHPSSQCVPRWSRSMSRTCAPPKAPCVFTESNGPGTKRRA